MSTVLHGLPGSLEDGREVGRRSGKPVMIPYSGIFKFIRLTCGSTRYSLLRDRYDHVVSMWSSVW